MCWLGAFLILFYCNVAHCFLWPSGVVHFSVNKKDYDLHSQDIIISTLGLVEKEICVKFFHTPLNYTATEREKVLYISNKERRKDCPPAQYDFSGSIVHMAVGYKCINERDVARIVVDMLRASVMQTVSIINSNDLMKKFQAKALDPSSPTLLAPADRNFINAHYVHECAKLSTRHGLDPSYRRSALTLDDAEVNVKVPDAETMSSENVEYYAKRLWPLGVVIYSVEKDERDTEDYRILKHAMRTIELDSCVVFQEASDDGMLEAKNMIVFGTGTEEPQPGYKNGKQSVNLHEFTNGAPAHSAHCLSNLMRILGVPMASNRPDRDNYITVNWKNVEKGKEHYLEKAPNEAWLRRQPYDFDSVTHAPANYACGQPCKLGGQTVQPIQDNLWQRTLSMGHKTELSPTDISYLKILYGNQCQYRLLPNPNVSALKDYSIFISPQTDQENPDRLLTPNQSPLSARTNNTLYDNFKITAKPYSTPWRPWGQPYGLNFSSSGNSTPATTVDKNNGTKKLQFRGRMRWG